MKKMWLLIRKGRFGAIYTMKTALNKRIEHRKGSRVLFLDPVKVFDRVPLVKNGKVRCPS